MAQQIKLKSENNNHDDIRKNSVDVYEYLNEHANFKPYECVYGANTITIDKNKWKIKIFKHKINIKLVMCI